MGYTHYWTPKAVDQKTWNKFLDVAIAMWKDCSVDIAGSHGTDFPTFSFKEICFNGVGDDSHEPFLISKEGEEWDFCKTARKPYDVLVTACLLAAKDILGYEISSDGNHEDWEPGRNLYAEHAPVDERAMEAEKIFNWLDLAARNYDAYNFGLPIEIKKSFITFYKKLR